MEEAPPPPPPPPPPKQMFLLKLKVVKGIDLPIMDVLWRSSDPYVIITMGKQTMTTQVVYQNLNPEWNEEFSLSITDPSEHIRFDVFDKDKWLRDDLIGNAELDIGLYAHAVQFLWHNCTLNSGSSIEWSGGTVVQDVTLELKNAKSGKIFLQLRWDNEQHAQAT